MSILAPPTSDVNRRPAPATTAISHTTTARVRRITDWSKGVGLSRAALERLAGLGRGYLGRALSGGRRPSKEAVSALQGAQRSLLDRTRGALLRAIPSGASSVEADAGRELLAELRSLDLSWPALSRHCGLSADHLRAVDARRKPCTAGSFAAVATAAITILHLTARVIPVSRANPPLFLQSPTPPASLPLDCPPLKVDTVSFSLRPLLPYVVDATLERHCTAIRPSQGRRREADMRLGSGSCGSVYQALRRLAPGVVVLSEPGWPAARNAAPFQVQVSAGATVPGWLLAALAWPGCDVQVARLDLALDLPVPWAHLQPVSKTKRTLETIASGRGWFSRLRVGTKGVIVEELRSCAGTLRGVSEGLGARGGREFYRSYDKAAERGVNETRSRLECELRPRCSLGDLAKIRPPFGDYVLVAPLLPGCGASAWVIVADMARRALGSAVIQNTLGPRLFRRFVRELDRHGSPALATPLHEAFKSQREAIEAQVLARLAMVPEDLRGGVSQALWAAGQRQLGRLATEPAGPASAGTSIGEEGAHRSPAQPPSRSAEPRKRGGPSREVRLQLLRRAGSPVAHAHPSSREAAG